MPHTAIERLERRYRQLARQQDDVAFVRQIKTYLDALVAEREAKRILKHLRQEAERAVDRFNATERELVKEAIDIRDRLAAAAHEVDNSGAPAPDRRSHAFSAWQLDSFANFDELARIDRRLEFAPLPYYGTGPKAPLNTMLIILRGRLRQAQYGDQGGLLSQQKNLRPDLDNFGREIHNLGEEHSQALNVFNEEGRTLPGLADERLRLFNDALTREPFLIEEGADEDEVAERGFLRGLEELSPVGYMRAAMAGQRLDAGEQQAFGELVGFLRAEVERLHEEVVDRMARGEGESRSRRFLTVVGRGSLKLGLFVAGSILVAIIGLLVTAYVAKWLPGQDGTKTGTPTTETTTPLNYWMPPHGPIPEEALAESRGLPGGFRAESEPVRAT